MDGVASFSECINWQARGHLMLVLKSTASLYRRVKFVLNFSVFLLNCVTEIVEMFSICLQSYIE